MATTKVVQHSGTYVRMFMEKIEPDGKHKNLAGTWPAPMGMKRCRAANLNEIKSWLNSGGKRVGEGEMLSVQIGNDDGGW